MQGIKALVIGMGVLIVAGLVLLGYGMYSRAGKLAAPAAPGAAQPAPPSVAAAPAPAFGTVPVALSPGARVEEMDAVGGRLAVRVTEGDTSRILLLDPGSGAVAGAFVLAPAR